MNVSCGYGWFVSEWSQVCCSSTSTPLPPSTSSSSFPLFSYFLTILVYIKCSKSCSLGFKTREVICAKISKEGHILNITSDKCSLSEKPIHRITCNYGDCGGSYFWQPGKWSKVSSLFPFNFLFLFFFHYSSFSFT